MVYATFIAQKEKNMLYFINFWESSQYDQDKLAWLCWQNKEIIALVRDPISRLKSGINHNSHNPHSIERFNLTFNCDEVVKYWMWYFFGESPNIHKSLTKGYFLSHKDLQVDLYFTPSSSKKITYIDMNDIYSDDEEDDSEEPEDDVDSTIEDDYN